MVYKICSKLKKQCKLNYRNQDHNSSLHMKQNSKLFALCEMPLHHRHSAGLDSSHHIMQIICLTGITVQQWWLLHCYPRGGKPYKDRLRYLNLPTLKYRRLRGDMLETYKILNDIYDNEAAPVLELSGTRMTRGNDKKLNKVMCKTDLRRHFFTQRVVDVWNSLPSEIINSASVNIFKNKLDKFWQTQEIFFDYKADIAGTGSRSWI